MNKRETWYIPKRKVGYTTKRLLEINSLLNKIYNHEYDITALTEPFGHVKAKLKLAFQKKYITDIDLEIIVVDYKAYFIRDLNENIANAFIKQAKNILEIQGSIGVLNNFKTLSFLNEKQNNIVPVISIVVSIKSLGVPLNIKYHNNINFTYQLNDKNNNTIALFKYMLKDSLFKYRVAAVNLDCFEDKEEITKNIVYFLNSYKSTAKSTVVIDDKYYIVHYLNRHEIQSLYTQKEIFLIDKKNYHYNGVTHKILSKQDNNIVTFTYKGAKMVDFIHQGFHLIFKENLPFHVKKDSLGYWILNDAEISFLIHFLTVSNKFMINSKNFYQK